RHALAPLDPRYPTSLNIDPLPFAGQYR
ncbi:uncharacterized protein METZ01_LOCUS91963, partial [marine metagenome]